MNPCPIDGECFGDLSAEVNTLLQTWCLRAFARGEMGGCRAAALIADRLPAATPVQSMDSSKM